MKILREKENFYFARIYIREFGQNSRKFVLAKIVHLRYVKIF